MIAWFLGTASLLLAPVQGIARISSHTYGPSERQPVMRMPAQGGLGAWLVSPGEILITKHSPPAKAVGTLACRLLAVGR